MSSPEGSLVGDLEIVAGQMWSGVGGPPAAGGGNNPLAQEVHFENVDPKKFGIEVAGCEPVEFVAGEEGLTKQILLGTLRPFKPMDMMITSLLYGTGLGTFGVILVAGAVESGAGAVDIGGTNQFTARNPVPLDCIFGSVLSAPRPRVQFGTVQTAPKLSIDIKCILPAGTILAASLKGKLRVYCTFGGVAAKM
jgi:hypothetical protein